MKKAILQPEQSLTFSDYAKFALSVEDVAAYFGYSHQPEALILPETAINIGDLQNLAEDLELNLMRVDTGSEIGIREFLIAPILMRILRLTDTRIRSEYALEVSHQLKGSLDYLLKSKSRMLIIEAKNGDLKRGFTQLAVELIALDRADDTEQTVFYGAVTIGDAWRFGKLTRTDKIIFEDINLFRVPADLRDLVKILIGVLENEN